MWKPAGVVCLWLAMIALPHFSSPAVALVPAGNGVATSAPADEPGAAPRDEHAASPMRDEASSFATIHFKNALDKTLTLVSASLVMDGQALPVTNLAPQADNVVFSGYVAPGPHVVTTHLTCKGRKRGAVFTYMTDYTWQVRSEQTLNALPNRSMVFRISAARHKGMNVPLDKQVDVAVYNELLPEPLSRR
jgi:hypothetical protein